MWPGDLMTKAASSARSSQVATARTRCEATSQISRSGPLAVRTPISACQKGRYWFGIEPDRSPRPLDLAHHTIINGYDVLLKDGNLWRIPETLQMPLDIGRDPDTGELTKFYSSHYEDFCKQAEKYVFVMFENILTLDILSQGEPNVKDEQIHVAFTLEDVWEYCCDGLATNYRVCDPADWQGIPGPARRTEDGADRASHLSMPDILEVIEKKKITSPCFHPRWTEHVTWRITRGDRPRGLTSTSSSEKASHGKKRRKRSRLHGD